MLGWGVGELGIMNLGRNKPTKQKERYWVFLKKSDMVSSLWMYSETFYFGNLARKYEEDEDERVFG